MLFSSLNFLFIFLPICAILYYLSPNIKVKNISLIVLSLVFYAFGEPIWIILLVACTLLNYILGRVIGGFTLAKSRLTTVLAIALNIAILAYFKLSNVIPGAESSTIPLGVSFFTFQCIAYIIDVYRRKITAQQNFLDFLLFITLFPQLIAGPILRYDDIAQQIKSRQHSWELVSAGIVLFVIGLSKKVIIADFAGSLVANSLGDTMSTPVQAWFGLLMFTFQIYFDFSGYSDMAIGLGKMFGFNYPENFKYPYVATSITDFWRRWHITLGAFFRDYLYIPLGGNRQRVFLNLFVVWVVTGLWHGVGVGFLLWGLYHFLLITIDKRIKIKIPTILARMFTFLLVYFGWSFFYFNLHDWLNFVRIAFDLNFSNAMSPLGTTLLIGNLPFVALCFIASTPVLPWLLKYMPIKIKQPLVIICTLGLLVVCTAFMFAQSYVPFLYYKF